MMNVDRSTGSVYPSWNKLTIALSVTAKEDKVQVNKASWISPTPLEEMPCVCNYSWS